jgi:rfaE bifunctional protein nucleotidyltransferase chain/domain
LGKVYTETQLLEQIKIWRSDGKKLVFTNGCFDVLHRGHVEYLDTARTYGDILIVGLNSDSSVRVLKGNDRPYLGQEDRAYILSQLIPVDAVVIFSEETPLKLINKIIPDILVKGGDYKKDEVVGRETVENRGGKLILVPLTPGRSSTSIIDKIRSGYQKV